MAPYGVSGYLQIPHQLNPGSESVPFAPQPALPSALGRSAGNLSTLKGKIVDENGTEVVLKGFALSGFESSYTMTGDPTSGSDSIAHDWRTNMYR